MVSLAPPFVRRLFAAAVVGLAVAGGVFLTPFSPGSGHASGQAEPSYSSVTIDTSPLGAALYKPTGERLRGMMTAEMKRRFSITGDMSKPRLVVRITDIVVPPEAAQDHNSGPTLVPSTDRMDGETLIIAADGKVLRRLPVTVSAPSSPASTSGVTPPSRRDDNGIEAEFRRLGQLAASFASWSARYAATP